MDDGNLPETQETAEPLVRFTSTDDAVKIYRHNVQAIVDDALAKLKEYQVTFGELLGEGLRATKRVRSGKGEYDDVPDHASRRSYMETWRSMYRDCMNIVVELTKATGIKVDNANILVAIPDTVRDRLGTREADSTSAG